MSDIVSAKVTPAMVIASASSVPSISASPDISSVAASNSPLMVIFLPPLISLFESVIIALLAITVPFVIPSIRLMSAALAVTPSSILSSAAVDVTVVPFIDKASVSSVPSTSTSPEMSRVAASSSPVMVMFLKPVTSLLLSTTTALDAETVPAVTPSIVSNSASFIDALPIMKESPDVMLPLDVIAPEATVPKPLTLPLVSNV